MMGRRRNRVRPVGAAASRRRRTRSRWVIALASVVVIAAGLAVPMLDSPRTPPHQWTYTELLTGIEHGRVAELTIYPGEAIRGRLTDDDTAGSEFEVVYPIARADALLERAVAAGVPVRFAPAPHRDRYKEMLALTVQLLLFGGIFYLAFLNLRSRGGNGDLARGANDSVTTFADVAGTQGAAEELREVVEFLRRPDDFVALGARVPKGVLLIGPPGTGKTLLARAVAGEAEVPFFQISGAEVTGFVVGLGAHRVRSLFRRARRHGGVIFIDEIDSLGGRRGRNRSHNEDDRTLNQLLVEMDGFAPSEGVVVIGATNRPEDLDPALRRPGRFDRSLAIGLPTLEGREAILRLHADRRRMPVAEDVDLRRLARLTPGASGADLAGLLNEAAIAAARERAQCVAWRHIESARDRLLLGRERVGFRAHADERRVIAYHEAGHALAGLLFCPEDGLHKVTIQPRGSALGVAHFSPEDDRHLHTRRYLEGQIMKGLAGRAAEEIVFGPDAITGGAENDLVQVNRVARKMIYRLGMGEVTGLLVGDDDAAPLAPETRAALDAEVRALLARLYATVHDALTRHRAGLDALAEALLAHEVVDGEEVSRILAEHDVDAGPAPAA
ncbi:MAG TPA: ATP-dependent metallopeptidase FtsH/Yme1/Tma family protein [Longimicrobiales bacterium]